MTGQRPRRTRETLSTALDRTLGALQLDDAAAAAARLAQMVARHLDSAAATAKLADQALYTAREDGDLEVVDMVAALRAKLGERAALDRLGARLASLLIELQATPRSRPAQPEPDDDDDLAQMLAGT